MRTSTTYVKTQCNQYDAKLIPTDTINYFKRYDIVAAYRQAKDMVLRAGFGEEISWQASVDFNSISESDFLREHAWVTLSAGMKERVIRNLFHAISSSFYYWESANKEQLAKQLLKHK